MRLSEMLGVSAIVGAFVACAAQQARTLADARVLPHEAGPPGHVAFEPAGHGPLLRPLVATTRAVDRRDGAGVDGGEAGRQPPRSFKRTGAVGRAFDKPGCLSPQPGEATSTDEALPI